MAAAPNAGERQGDPQHTQHSKGQESRKKFSLLDVFHQQRSTPVGTSRMPRNAEAAAPAAADDTDECIVVPRPGKSRELPLWRPSRSSAQSLAPHPAMAGSESRVLFQLGEDLVPESDFMGGVCTQLQLSMCFFGVCFPPLFPSFSFADSIWWWAMAGHIIPLPGQVRWERTDTELDGNSSSGVDNV